MFNLPIIAFAGTTPAINDDKNVLDLNMNLMLLLVGSVFLLLNVYMLFDYLPSYVFIVLALPALYLGAA